MTEPIGLMCQHLPTFYLRLMKWPKSWQMLACAGKESLNNFSSYSVQFFIPRARTSQHCQLDKRECVFGGVAA